MDEGFAGRPRLPEESGKPKQGMHDVSRIAVKRGGCRHQLAGHPQKDRGHVAARALRVGLVLVAVNSLLLFCAGPALAETCPNEEQRTGASAHLPECRAYEMVSPLEKAGGAINPNQEHELGELVGETTGVSTRSQKWRASADGNAIVYSSLSAFAGTPGGILPTGYIARRSASGWSTEGLLPPLNPSGDNTLYEGNTQYTAFSPELTTGVLQDRDAEGPLLATGAVAGFPNLYLHELGAGSYTTLAAPEPPGIAAYPGSIKAYDSKQYFFDFIGASANYSHVVFAANAKLTENAAIPSSELATQLYEWTNGHLTAVNILPVDEGGEATPEATGGSEGQVEAIEGQNQAHNAVSQNGEVIYWTDHLLGPGGIYVRENGTETVPVGMGFFWAATPDGQHAIYTTEGPGGALEGGDLEEFDLATGESTDLSPSGEVLGVVGESEDLSYIYFVAEGVLAPGAEAKKPNLYVYHEGTTTLVAALPTGEESKANGTGFWSIDNWGPANHDAYVTPDGKQLAFVSSGSLTGYPTAPANPRACLAGGINGNTVPCPEVYYYDATTGKLFCASCGKSGTLPEGPSGLLSDASATYTPRWMSNDGDHLFFDTWNALAPGDTNNQQDVYEWVPDETGSCALAEGCQYLISGGSGGTSDPHTQDAPLNDFVDASEDGSNVFFTTQQQLVPADTDQASDLYDARVDGGFPAAASTAPCEEGAMCQSSSPSPALSTPGSLTFSGPGNLTPPMQPVAKPTPLTRAQKLANALKACRKDRAKRKRLACEKRSRVQYGVKHTTKEKGRLTRELSHRAGGAR